MSDVPTIRPANEEDVNAVKRLADRNVLSNARPEDRAASGFLVSGFSERDYRRFVSYADYFFVLQARRRVDAFVLAYSSELIRPNEAVNTIISKRVNRPFVLIKQVCVHFDSRGRGYGKILYDEVARRSEWRDQYAAVVTNPRNEISQRFHERLGFRVVMELAAPDGMPREIWARTFPRKPSLEG